MYALNKLWEEYQHLDDLTIAYKLATCTQPNCHFCLAGREVMKRRAEIDRKAKMAATHYDREAT